jgi:ribosomal protein S18 acetylase RimI-like enzyme
VPVTVRDAMVVDARAIAEVHVASWRWAYRDLIEDDILDALSVDEREAQWNDTLTSADAVVFVAERAGTVCGFSSAGASNDADTPPDIGEVYAIYLTRDAAGMGIGHALLRATQERLAERFDGARLWVLETNERARSFYHREGWRRDGVRSDHRLGCGTQPIVRYAVRWRPCEQPPR